MHKVKREELRDYALKDIMELNRDELRDIAQVQIAKEKPVREKLESILSQEDLTTHVNDGYVVRVHFSQEDYSATDALKQYIKQIAQIKY